MGGGGAGTEWKGVMERCEGDCGGMKGARELKTQKIETTHPELELRRAVLGDEVDQPMHPQVGLLLVKPQGLDVPEVGDDLFAHLFLHDTDLVVQLGHPSGHEKVALVGVLDTGAGKNKMGRVVIFVVERKNGVIDCAGRHDLEQRRKSLAGGDNAHGGIGGGGIGEGRTEGEGRRGAGNGGTGRDKIGCVLLSNQPVSKSEPKAE